jgi:hypothetical protein
LRIQIRNFGVACPKGFKLGSGLWCSKCCIVNKNMCFTYLFLALRY